MWHTKQGQMNSKWLQFIWGEEASYAKGSSIWGNNVLVKVLSLLSYKIC